MIFQDRLQLFPASGVYMGGEVVCAPVRSDVGKAIGCRLKVHDRPVRLPDPGEPALDAGQGGEPRRQGPPAAALSEKG